MSVILVNVVTLWVITKVRKRLPPYLVKASGQPITKCCFSADGQVFAYSVGYDWSKVRQIIENYLNSRPASRL